MRYHEHFSDNSAVGQLWLPMCGGLSVAYNACCNAGVVTCGGSSDGVCEMFFDGSAALLANLVAAQERMARK